MALRWYIVVAGAASAVLGARGNVLAASARAWASLALTERRDASLREANNTIADINKCSAELDEAKRGLVDAQKAVESALSDVETSATSLKNASGHKTDLQRRVDGWKDRLSNHSSQIGQLNTLVADFADKLRTDQQGISVARERLQKQMATIKEQEDAHEKKLLETAIDKQALDKMRDFPDADNWRLAQQNSELKKKMESQGKTSDALKKSLQDAREQETDLKAREASWVNNRQILTGMMQYLDWSREMFVQQRRAYYEEAQELSSISDLVGRHDQEFKKAQQELQGARVSYGQAVQHLVKEQDDELSAVRAHHRDTTGKFNRAREVEKRALGEAARNHEEYVKRALRNHEKQVEGELNKTISGAKSAHAKEVAVLRARHAAEVAAHKAHHAEVLKERAQHMDDLKASHAKEVDNLKEQNARQLEELKGEQSLRKEDLDRQSDHLKDMQAMHTASVDALKDAHSQHFVAASDMQSQYLHHMEEQHKEELDTLRGEHADQTDRLQKQHSENTDRAEDQHDLHIQDLQNLHSDQLRSMEEEIMVREDEIAELDEHIGEMTRLQSAALEAYKTQSDMAATTHSSQLQAVREQTEAALQAREDTINQLVERQSQEIAARDAAIARLQEGIAAHRLEIADQHGVITQNAATVGALKEALNVGGKAMDQVQDAFQSTRDTLCRCMKRGQDLEDHIGAINGDMSTMHDAMGQHRYQNDQLKDIVGQHKYRSEQLNDIVGQYKYQSEQLEYQNDQLKDAVGQHKYQNDQLKYQNDQLKEAVGQHEYQNDQHYDSQLPYYNNQPYYNAGPVPQLAGPVPYGSSSPTSVTNYYSSNNGPPNYGYTNGPPSYGDNGTRYYGYNTQYAYGSNYGNSLAPRWTEPKSDSEWLQSRLDYLRQSMQIGKDAATAESGTTSFASAINSFARATNLLRSGGTVGASGAAGKQAVQPAQVPPLAPVIQPQQARPVKVTGEFKLKVQQLARLANGAAPGH